MTDTADLAAYLLFVLDFTDLDEADSKIMANWRAANMVSKHDGDCTGKTYTCIPCYLESLQNRAAALRARLPDRSE